MRGLHEAAPQQARCSTRASLLDGHLRCPLGDSASVSGGRGPRKEHGTYRFIKPALAFQEVEHRVAGRIRFAHRKVASSVAASRPRNPGSVGMLADKASATRGNTPIGSPTSSCTASQRDGVARPCVAALAEGTGACHPGRSPPPLHDRVNYGRASSPSGAIGHGEVRPPRPNAERRRARFESLPQGVLTDSSSLALEKGGPCAHERRLGRQRQSHPTPLAGRGQAQASSSWHWRRCRRHVPDRPECHLDA